MIYHLALAADWASAKEHGDYRVSTLGRTLEQEGFLHCSLETQWEAVRDRFYREVTVPLLLLEIDPDLLTSPLRFDLVPESEEPFPHIYGPLNLDAVVGVRPLD